MFIHICKCVKPPLTYTHTQLYMHTYIYIYKYICVCTLTCIVCIFIDIYSFVHTSCIAVHHAFGSIGRQMSVCCSVLQCVAVCCSVLHCVAVCCSVLQRDAVCCSVLQCVAVCCSVLQCVAARTISTTDRCPIHIRYAAHSESDARSSLITNQNNISHLMRYSLSSHDVISYLIKTKSHI